MGGDLDLDQLYHASYRRLVVQMYAICGNAAEDAVQNAFVAALRKQRELRRVANPEAWVADRDAETCGLGRRDGNVAQLTRLVTLVDCDDDVADPRQMSMSARHEAVLMDGGTVFLLGDRGWSTSGPPDIWAMTSVEDIVDTARMVVGPDAPFGVRSQQDMEADHWASLAAILRRRGIDADAPTLVRLPQDVVLSKQLQARLGDAPGAAQS